MHRKLHHPKLRIRTFMMESMLPHGQLNTEGTLGMTRQWITGFGRPRLPEKLLEARFFPTDRSAPLISTKEFPKMSDPHNAVYVGKRF